MNEPPDRRRTQPRRRRWLWILAAQLVLLLAGLAAIEVGHRLLTQSGRSHSRSETREQWLRTRASIHSDLPVLPRETNEEPRREERVLHPFTGYDKVLALEAVAEEVERHARGEYESTYEILIVGGSVSKLLCDSSGDEIARLVSLDPRFDGRDVRMLCLGSGGFKQPQQVMLAAWLFSLGLVPDALINIDGYNEVALGLANVQNHGIHPLFPSFSHWGDVTKGTPLSPENVVLGARMVRGRERVQQICSVALGARLYVSSFGSDLVGRLLTLQRGRIQSLQKRLTRSIDGVRSRLLSGPPLPKRAAALEPGARPLDDLPIAEGGANGGSTDGALSPEIAARMNGLLDLMTEGWVMSSRSLAGLCGEHGVHYLHVLQPTLHDSGSKPVTPMEERVGTAGPSAIVGITNGYPRFRSAASELASAGVLFHDASRLFADDQRTLYVDACHFNDAGNQALAADVAAAFLASLP